MVVCYGQRGDVYTAKRAHWTCNNNYHYYIPITSPCDGGNRKYIGAN